MNSDEIFDMIRRHEGYSDTVYLDTEGVPTGGYGHAFLVGSKISSYIANALLWLDAKTAFDDYDSLNLELDLVRRAVLIDMLFNLGRTKLLKFRKFLAALRAGDYELASVEMLDSKWAGQVKGRAIELAEMMKKGE